MKTITYILCNKNKEPRFLVTQSEGALQISKPQSKNIEVVPTEDKNHLYFYVSWEAVPKEDQIDLLKKVNKISEGDIIQ